MLDVVVTSFSAGGARLYGQRMVETAARYWPSTTQLVAYVDAPVRLAAGEVRLTSELTEWVALRQRWAHDRVVQGQSTEAVPRRKPYSYRWDAFRFCVKPFVQRDAARRMGRGILTWLDGDTVTLKPVPFGFAADLLADADVTFLGRGSMHPETGYVGFRVPEALPVLDWCCDAYASERFRQLHGWTDCHILRAALDANPGVKARDLTGHRYVGKSHIWPVSPLAPFVTHLKGKNKREATQKRRAASC